MKGLPRVVLIGFFVVACVLVLLLVGELALLLDRRSDARSAEEYRAGHKNIFALVRINELADGSGPESVWEVPWERYRPEARLELDVGPIRYEIRINRHGFRTPEFEVPKPAGVIRVLCIGGSTTVEGRTNDTTYPAVLGQLLTERFPQATIEVLNLGISGTNSDYWIPRIAQLFSYEPDLIVQYNAVNDISWRYLQRHAELHPWKARVHRRYLAQKLSLLDPFEFDPFFQMTLANFSKIREEARARGVDYVVGSFAAPRDVQADPEFAQYLDVVVEQFWGGGLLRYYAGYQALISRFNQLLGAWIAEQGVHGVPIEERITDPDLFVDICHLTEAGIARKAEVFAESIAGLLEARIERLDRVGSRSPISMTIAPESSRRCWTTSTASARSNRVVLRRMRRGRSSFSTC